MEDVLMITIVIFNRKGGVGKSTTCVNTAGCLDYKFKKNVLVIDCDAQMNATTCLTINGDESWNKNTVLDLFQDTTHEYSDYITKATILDKRDQLIETGISLVPGSRDLDSVSTDNMFAIKDFISKYNDMFDYCLLDCPPALTDTTINALCAADYVVVPALPGRDSVNGYSMVIDEINMMKENGYNVNIKVLGVLLNQVNKRRGLDNFYETVWGGKEMGNAFKSQIRNSADVASAYEFGKPLHYYKATCPAAEDYNDFVYELIHKIDALERKGGKK